MKSDPQGGRNSQLERLLQKGWLGKAFLALIVLLAVWKLGTELLDNPWLFVAQVVNGLQLGFVLALISLGYTMVYGIVRLINFAHGDVFMVGAFISYYLIARTQLHIWPEMVFPGISPGISVAIGLASVISIAMVVCALLAFTIERIAYKPLRNAPRISALITAIGVSFFLEYFGALPFVFSNNFITYKRPFAVSNWVISISGIQTLQPGQPQPPNSVLFSNISLIIVIISLVLLGVLQFVVRRTTIGKAMRATAYDKQTARLMGINVDAIISVTFGLGAALAAAGGVLYAIAFPQVTFTMGILPGLKAFVAAVLGGIGSIPGAVIGSLILAQAEVLSAGYISTPLRDAVAFTILILVLLVKPTGLFGEPSREKA